MSNTWQQPCKILDAAELEQANHPLQWRIHTETIRTNQVFGSETNNPFPNAFQSYKPTTIKSNIFQTNKKSATRSLGRIHGEPLLNPSSFSTSENGALFRSVKSMFQGDWSNTDELEDPLYASCTPPLEIEENNQKNTTN